jgi:uncharacterized protein (TIGR00661 family)
MRKIGRNDKKPLILFSPLDWGMGHTTRCIPLLTSLLESGCEVLVACNSTQKIILENELPNLRFVDLEGYEVRVAGKNGFTKLKIVAQITNILTKIKGENRWLSRFLNSNKVDAVISDNRYGLYNAFVTCIFITHQLRPYSGLGLFIDAIMQRFLYSYVNKFHSCWIPDYQHPPGLAGNLSHAQKKPKIPVSYIGCMSRLQISQTHVDINNELLIILSGPEPQRSLFENLLLEELAKAPDDLKSRTIIIRARPSASSTKQYINGIACYDHVNANHLSALAHQSAFIISRSGYTTLMDMFKLKKKMILVPTPGQAEQEYLAEVCAKNNYALSYRQHSFSLLHALNAAKAFHYSLPEFDMELYKKTINEFSKALLLNHAGS